ncbi:hypothetical protein ACFYTV_24535, partial [Streptomyces sp. NPDC004562]
MATTTTPDGRPVPPPHADERSMLEAWLDFHRATLGPLVWIMPGSRGLVPHLAALSSVAMAPPWR